MKLPDQCPSTKGEKSPDAGPRELQRQSGRAYWRSVEEFADAPEFREFVEREFPAGASELAESSRRDFLKLMGASMALAGAATIPGCRRPEQKIMPYSKNPPEEIIPGEPLFYATSMPLPGGGAEGLLVETHEARPTKVEGNPLHPINQGRSSLWAQASILQIYDPDRLVQPIYRGGDEDRFATWDDFTVWQKDHFTKFDGNGGRGLAFLVGKKTSPSRDRMRDAVMQRWPQAQWIPYEPVDDEAPVEGSATAFASPHREVLHLDRARVIVSLDRDFVDPAETDFLRHSREFAATRRLSRAGDEMSRLYVVEPGFSAAGGMADHRLRLAPSRIPAFAVALGREVLQRRPAQGAAELDKALRAVSGVEGEGIDEDFLDAVVSDLLASTNRGRTLLVAGPSQPPAIHALVHALNAALGNVGTTVNYRPLPADIAASSQAGIEGLARSIESGRVDTLVCVDVDPVYNAPAGLDFAAKFARVPHTITLEVGPTETGAASEWQLNMAHWLESWGDTRAADGTIAPTQPMIAPIFSPALNEIELLALLAGVAPKAGEAQAAEGEQTEGSAVPPRPTAYDIVRETWSGFTSSRDFEKRWRRALHDGVVPGTQQPLVTPGVAYGAVAEAVRSLSIGAAPTLDAMDVVFETTNIHDGRYANCGWLQELPHGATRVTWDNPLLLSPKTAEALRLIPDAEAINHLYNKERIPVARMAMVRIDGHSVPLPVWVMPGLADNTAVVTLGYGRKVCGRVGGDASKNHRVGFNTYALRDAASKRTSRGAGIERISETYTIASTQNHWSLEGRDAIVRQLDKRWWDEYAAKPNQGAIERHGHYGTDTTLSLAERLGEMSHTPPNRSIYENPFNESTSGPAPSSTYSKRPQWGMTIDMSACTGCGVCTIACQAENNIPIVGKKEVAKGREMTWIRVDRYFTGEDLNDPDEMVHQPVACVHCENAPCETVCPVNATVHGPEGINYMVYNRCIGTRYCANNCPYKVRRFNFFDFGVKQFNGGYRESMPEGVPAPDNINLIPPRLRAKLDEIEHMKMNPDVTVRSRGVMEKCTYCIQRINQARHEVKLQGLDNVPDGFFEVACQQACPSGAIVFGDTLDESSRVHATRSDPRSYLLLGYLDTRPRTSHMLRIRNPNMTLLQARWKAKLAAGKISQKEYDERMADPFAHHGGGHGKHNGHNGHDGHDEGHGGDERAGHSFLIEPHKRREDAGYALSLRVLGSIPGVHA